MINVSKMGQTPTDFFSQKPSEDPKLIKSAHEFEGLFMSSIWQQACESQQEDSDFCGSSSQEKMYRSIFIQEVSQNMGPGSHGFGLAEKIVEQLSSFSKKA